MQATLLPEPIHKTLATKPSRASAGTVDHDEALESLEAILAQEEEAILSNDLQELARLHRPEFLSAVGRFTQERRVLLDELWDLVYLVRQLIASGEVGTKYPAARIQIVRRMQREIVNQEQELISEIMWCDLGGEGGSMG
jgi:hypothetical protein